MTSTEIKALVKSLSVEEEAQLIETHISWVILTHEFAYKFKKPIRYSFLNYGKLIHRKYYCEREVELNNRFSEIYLDVVPVYRKNNTVQLKGGEIIDYGVKMLKMNADFQMDRMLKRGLVKSKQMKKLAHKIANFHRDAKIIRKPFSPRDLSSKFDDIKIVKDFLYQEIGMHAVQLVNDAILDNNHFISSNIHLFENRVKYGFVRDLHGDLHAKNIFLYKKPILFDCIEFNDSFREIDILNEIAFLCMDLEASGNYELCKTFVKEYLGIFPVMSNPGEEKLFTYYKCYRANVRAKVNALRAKQAKDQQTKKALLQEVQKYLNLMTRYLDQFNGSSSIEICDMKYDYNQVFVQSGS